MLDNDEQFVLFFIMGNFFGPDLKGERPQKSILQRVAEGLPPYTLDQLSGSHLNMLEIEQVFRYILTNSDQSLLVKSRQFLQGNLPKLGDNNYPQFLDLFPLALHPHSKLSDQNMIVENISVISEPDTRYMDRDEIERFRRLSGLKDLVLDGCVSQNAETDKDYPKKMRCVNEVLELESDSLGMVIVPSFPTKWELSNIVAATKSGFALTGSAAAAGKLGSSIGLLDIGECFDSYLFRISLPGVKRDARDFSCEVESDGKVVIRGVTSSGEKTVYRYSHMFEMQTQNLCPPGRFSISFKLPGPVHPHEFSGNFGTDGILEGIILKGRQMVDN